MTEVIEELGGGNPDPNTIRQRLMAAVLNMQPGDTLYDVLQKVDSAAAAEHGAQVRNGVAEEVARLAQQYATEHMALRLGSLGLLSSEG